jgi:formylglycine-generating enzyme required for sulfatase activity
MKTFGEDSESKKYREMLLEKKDIKSYKDLYDEYEEDFLALEQPIVNISYYEAKAFCAWLTEKSKLNEKKENYKFNLPTNDEFEYVATKGLKENIYPWGNDWDNKKCNNSNTNINTTSVVGLFSDGNSPFGICDMSGNVWKWMKPSKKNKSFILKGASWYDSVENGFSISYENFKIHPDACYYFIGFFLTRTK